MKNRIKQRARQQRSIRAMQQQDLRRAESLIVLLGGLNEAKSSVQRAKIMRTLKISVEYQGGYAGVWVDDAQDAIQMIEQNQNQGEQNP